jgi:hypothetical protein
MFGPAGCLYVDEYEPRNPIGVIRGIPDRVENRHRVGDENNARDIEPVQELLQVGKVVTAFVRGRNRMVAPTVTAKIKRQSGHAPSQTRGKVVPDSGIAAAPVQQQRRSPGISSGMDGPSFNIVQSEPVYVDCFALGRDHNTINAPRAGLI